MFNKPNYNICSDALQHDIKELERWTLTKGTVKIRISRTSGIYQSGHTTPYYIDLVLTDAAFAWNNKVITVDEVVFRSIEVNYLMG